MDIVDKETRSRIMRSVPQRDTAPEVRLRHALHRLGFRYRLHGAHLPGRPDLIFPKYEAAVFVHGCYWHAHGCRYSTRPATRAEFWESKFRANKARDARVVSELLAMGWRVLLVWECAMKPAREEVLQQVAAAVSSWLDQTDCMFGQIDARGLATELPDHATIASITQEADRGATTSRSSGKRTSNARK